MDCQPGSSSAVPEGEPWTELPTAGSGLPETERSWVALRTFRQPAHRGSDWIVAHWTATGVPDNLMDGVRAVRQASGEWRSLLDMLSNGDEPDKADPRAAPPFDGRPRVEA